MRMRFGFISGDVFLELERAEGLDLLNWLGFGRAEFGSVTASDLLARCRRRLWPEFGATPHTEHVAALARGLVRGAKGAGPQLLVQFG
jgi:hypothetical protein